jgi:hypothetical protein
MHAAIEAVSRVTRLLNWRRPQSLGESNPIAGVNAEQAAQIGSVRRLTKIDYFNY